MYVYIHTVHCSTLQYTTVPIDAYQVYSITVNLFLPMPCTCMHGMAISMTNCIGESQPTISKLQLRVDITTLPQSTLSKPHRKFANGLCWEMR